MGTYVLAGLLAATGGARPTGVAAVDVVVLGLGGAAAAACALRARTIPVYVAAAAAAILQTGAAPLVLALIALTAAFSRGMPRVPRSLGALAGGLAWAAAVGAPFSTGARPIFIPIAAVAWVGWSARRHGSSRFRRSFDRTSIALGLTTLVCAGVGAVAVVNARAHVDRGADLVDAGLQLARQGDSDAAVEQLQAATRALARGEASLGAAWARPAWLVPGVSQNVRALHSIVEEVRTLAATGITSAEEADIRSLRARRGRIDLAAVAAVEEPLIEVLAQLRTSSAELEGLGDAWLAFPVRNRLVDLRTELDDAATSVELAIDGVRAAPSLLGGEGRRTYLVLFTTPVEARATTGFPGNFAEVTFDEGRFEMTRFGRMSELVDALPVGGGSISGPTDYLARYSRFGPHMEWRNITLSPDFPTVARVAAELYPQSGGTNVDGVMSVDPVALAALLNFTGPVAVPGVAQPVTAPTAAEFLLLDQYVALPDNPERIDALEALAEVTFDRLTTIDLPGPRELGAILGPVVTEKHLQFATSDDGEMRFLERLGITGAYPTVEGDFLGVTTSNAAGNKIDLFLGRSLDYDVRWEPSTGAVLATATITLTNEAPERGLPDYVIGNVLGDRALERSLPPGWSNTFLTLYTPWNVTDATLDGEPLPLERVEELDRWALSTFVAVGPGSSRTVKVTLEGALDEPAYHLGLAAQPLVQPEEASVSVTVAGAGADRLRTEGPVEGMGSRVGGSFDLVRDVRISIAQR